MTDSIKVEILRQNRGWTQQQMADYLGVDRSTVSRLENGQAASGPVRRLLEQLAAQLMPQAAAAEHAEH